MTIAASQVLDILRNPYDREWSIQGLGMLRTYLDDERVERLHIWSPSHVAVGTTTVHDHPWDFQSRIVSGVQGNQRFVPTVEGAGAEAYMEQRIHCGVGGGPVAAPRPVWLQEQPAETFVAGDVYSMDAVELHESHPEPGTVTIIQRRFHADLDTARVFFQGERWGSAEPRVATTAEVQLFVDLALERWNG